MAKIAVLLPKEFMKEQAERVISKFDYNIQSVKVIKSVDAIMEARNAVSAGADVIVARGYQARLIEENTNIPVAEMKVSVQDLGLLIKQAKKLANKEVPRVAIVAFKNMIEDTSYFKELFNVDVYEYYIDDFEEIDYIVQAILENDIDVVLGGETIETTLAKYNVPILFLSSTDNSVENAFKLADRMGYAIDIEHSNKAYMDIVMETSFNGIIKVDNERRITAVNHAIENILNVTLADVTGSSIETILPEINLDMADDVLKGRKENYSTSIRMNDVPVMLIMAPIKVEGSILGAILSVKKLEAEKKNSESVVDMIMNGFTAKYKFHYINTTDKTFQENIELAKKYALIASPVLVVGEDGIAREKIAQSIHNNSNRKTAPYISVNCAGMSKEEQIATFFGDSTTTDNLALQKGVLEACNMGTLHIDEIEKMDISVQYKLMRVINSLPVFKPDILARKKYDVKIIISSKIELWSLVKKGEFREDLYYSICPFLVKIPPLRKRQEDMKKIIIEHLKQFTDRFSTYLNISEEAINAILEFDWEGNEIQLGAFCDRMLLTTNKKSIEEDYVRNLLEQLYPRLEKIDNEERFVIYKHPESEEIIRLLEEHRGNRAAVAKAMNISTTTLWRKMKKYGILN